jgi:glycosyltransferase involved in cell wall biosynthesis
MATGLPVICSQNTGANEIIQNNEHGFLVPACDAQALAEKILYCYQNPDLCAQMGLSGQKHILNFSWDNYGNKIFDIYQNIVCANIMVQPFISNFSS